MSYSYNIRILFVCLFVLGPQLCWGAFDDFGYGARALGLGGAFVAVEGDLASSAYNPSGVGAIKKIEIGSNFSKLFRIPSGSDRVEQVSGGIAIPLTSLTTPGAFSLMAHFSTLRDRFRDKEWDLNYGTYRWLDWGPGTLDTGLGVKILNRATLDHAASKGAISLDWGNSYRLKERYVLGLSVLNINQPDLTVAGFQDKAPLTFKIGMAEKSRDFVLAMDVTQRGASGPQPGGYTVATGAEYGWLPFRYGSIAARTGLSLGNQSRTWNVGFSCRVMGAELHYAFLLPLSATFQMSHVFTFLLRFGEADPQEEYEKVLRQEIRYREDLVRSLAVSSQREEKLSKDLAQMHNELEMLQQRLASKSAEASQAQSRIKEFSEKHEKLQQNVRQLKENREKIKENELHSRFRQDWASYRKLKDSGAPKNVLTTTLERILREYRGTGIDLSEVNLEFRKLLEK
ncbi:MAG: hypothetical protein HY399_09015 [Elusimicrobia bacterium]|nr:hypothetical protein [Elusimicrobiota bacterium]